MEEGAQVVWRDGILRDVTESAGRVHVALATLSCPLAYSRRSAFGARIAADELAWAAMMLGHATAPRSELIDAVLSAVSGCGAEVAAVALVPTTLPSSGLAQWEDTQVVAWPVSPLRDPLMAAVFEPPLNEHGAAVSLRVTGDAEEGLSRRWATAQGVEVAIRCNLAGNVCRVGAWSIIVEWKGVLVTPSLHDGAPYDGWRRGLVERGDLTERNLSFDMLKGDVACLAGWGDAYNVAVAGGLSSGELANRLNAWIERLTAAS